jgi:hypothetical protein
MKRYLLRQRLRQRSREVSSRIMRDKTAAFLFWGSPRIKKRQDSTAHTDRSINYQLSTINYQLSTTLLLLDTNTQLMKIPEWPTNW